MAEVNSQPVQSIFANGHMDKAGDFALCDAYGNVISGSDSTTQGSAFHSNIPAPLQSQDSGDGVSTQDWITNEKLGIDENNNSY